MSTSLCFVDTETTGLDPHRHHIWEAAVILAEHDEQRLKVEQRNEEFIKLPKGAMRQADATALRMTHFYTRTGHIGWDGWMEPEEFATVFARWTAERHLVGAVPNFDDRRLEDLLRANGQAPAWHYHLIDIEALVAGYLAASVAETQRKLAVPPWKSTDLTTMLGVTVKEELRHTAMGDADWAMRTYAAVYDLTITE